MVKSVFFTGATGYVGGAALQQILDDKSFKITALVRNADKAKKLNELGIATIIGSLTDEELIAKAASEADIVFNVADCDNEAIMTSFLKGMKQRFQKTGEAPIFLHTSGSAIVMDGEVGMKDSEEIWPDNDVARLNTLPSTALHRNVDLMVFAADEEGYVKSYIVCPSTIWGTVTGPLANAGILHKHSIQIPYAVQASVARGQGGVVGEGKNIWPHVNVHDVADLFALVLRAAISGTVRHGRQGYFFAENGEYRIIDAARAYTKTLHELGKSATAEPTSFTGEEIVKYFGGPFLGSNCRIRAVLGRELGWKPVKTTEDFIASIPGATKAVVSGL
ncbi:hypothetical protein K488DRAFT_55440 [Vararia minispora EC-137]|uniref:Uncharacterized protein n=1 Tax=Vararia minispora EC-137 TaxID=1314806 RepID=A0ACB8QDZ1_9AGAM|nr:hypothetical protein K488DRAFT_55440 [Vararia minispora EC-137]